MRNEMGQISAMMGKQAQPMPDSLKEMVRAAEKLKAEKKGL